MSKILIIEDEAAIRRVLLKILSEENPDYKVSEAEDGLQGVEFPIISNFLCTIFFKRLFSTTNLLLSKAIRTVFNKRFKSGGLEI